MKKFYFLMLILSFFPFHVFSDEIFLSLKKNKVNVRYGPSFESPVKFIYKILTEINYFINKKKFNLY